MSADIISIPRKTPESKAAVQLDCDKAIAFLDVSRKLNEAERERQTYLRIARESLEKSMHQVASFCVNGFEAHSIIRGAMKKVLTEKFADAP